MIAAIAENHFPAIAEIEKVLSQGSLSLRSLGSGFHMIAIIPAITNFFFFLAIERSYGNRALGLARVLK